MYVSNRSTGDINILTFPEGQPVGAITGFGEPEGECVDAAGNVYITDAQNASIQVFAHGGVAPIRTLRYSNAQPYDCSIDPVSGNLAVTNHTFSRKAHSLVAIFAGAQGTPKTYSFPGFQTPYCGYDGQGNLYIDGSDRRTEIAELPKGGNAVVNAFLNQPVIHQASILWDGHYVVITSLNPAAYRVTFSGRNGTIVGTTSLSGTSGDRLGIAGSEIVGAGSDYVYSWGYPAGGTPLHRYSGFTEAADAVVTP